MEQKKTAGGQFIKKTKMVNTFMWQMRYGMEPQETGNWMRSHLNTAEQLMFLDKLKTNTLLIQYENEEELAAQLLQMVQNLERFVAVQTGGL